MKKRVSSQIEIRRPQQRTLQITSARPSSQYKRPPSAGVRPQLANTLFSKFSASHRQPSPNLKKPPHPKLKVSDFLLSKLQITRPSNARKTQVLINRDKKQVKINLTVPNKPQNLFLQQVRPVGVCFTPTIGDYTIGAQIGKGAYAVVKRGYHNSSGQKVAVKIYQKFYLVDSNRRNGVTRQIKILKKLNHPNIVKLFENIESSKHVFLILEYIPGFSIFQYLQRRTNKKLPNKEAKQIFIQIIEAVQHCHSKKISHRDLKLENILIDSSKKIKIIDFGFATCFSNEKKVKLFCGTPSYMAPQIVNKVEFLGPPADIWACGVILFFLLCGQHPFKGSNQREIYSKIANGRFSVPQWVHPQAKILIQKMLQYQPSRRPSADQILSSPWLESEDEGLKPFLLVKQSQKGVTDKRVPFIGFE